MLQCSVLEVKAVKAFDLVEYYRGFDSALKKRYKDNNFAAGRERISNHFRDVGFGKRELVIDDVMEIFRPDLPFVEDWTKPDPINLAERMGRIGVAKKIADLRHKPYDLNLLKEIIYCFREVSLTLGGHPKTGHGWSLQNRP